MLWHLRESGKLEGIRGIIFGEMLDCNSPGTPDDFLESVILSALVGMDIPIAFGLRSGHVSRQNVTLIFGVEAELQAAVEAQLTLLEPAVRL
jgi:muramoyltetrapeptide carboxypeptidase